MSDARVRDAERRWLETDDPADQARLLLERLRCGALTEGDLAPLAHCGHPAALAALGRPAPPPDEPGKAVSLLRRWGSWRLPAAAALGLARALDRPRAGGLVAAGWLALTDRSEDVRASLRRTLAAFVEAEAGRAPGPGPALALARLEVADRVAAHAASAVRDERVAEAMQAARSAELLLGRARTLEVAAQGVAALVLGGRGS